MKKSPLSTQQKKETRLYSKQVRLWRVLLPSLTVVGVVLLFLWPYGASLLEGGDKKSPLKREFSLENRLIEPCIVSLDKKGKPYQIKAKSALSDMNHSALENPESSLELESGKKLTISSDKGLYKEKDRTLCYEDHVRLETGEIQIDTEKASLDLETREAEGDQFVTGKSPSGTFKGEGGFKTSNEGKTLHLKGKSQIILQSE